MRCDHAPELRKGRRAAVSMMHPAWMAAAWTAAWMAAMLPDGRTFWTLGETGRVAYFATP